jgi:hypothetical protein
MASSRQLDLLAPGAKTTGKKGAGAGGGKGRGGGRRGGGDGDEPPPRRPMRRWRPRPSAAT